MPYKLKINGIQFESEVEGTDDWGRTVSRDFNDRIFRTKGEYRFKGHKELYNLLYNQLAINGVCEALEGRIFFNTGTAWDYEWRGEIKPQDFTFDLIRKNADGQILDNAWASKFNNRQDQKAFLLSDKSLNDVYIGVCDFNQCQLFDPTDSTLSNYLPDRRRCFRVYDVFNWLVKYYTDDTVTFASDYFAQPGGDGEQYYITTGYEIRVADNTLNPEISFSELFTEMNKKLNLFIIIEGTQDAPILRIENWEYVFRNTAILDIRDPEKIELTTDLDQLYTTIDVGSASTAYDVDNNAEYPDVRFKTWLNESYNTAGACQFENNSLDLISTWKIDNNSIQQCLSGVEDFDSDIFILEIDPTAPDYDAYKFTTEFTAGSDIAYIYNYNLTNEQVINRWFNGIPQEMVKNLTKDYKCYVGRTTSYSVTSPTVFPDDYAYEEIVYNDDSSGSFYDPDDIYTTPAEASGDDTAGEFKAPIGGVYRFQVELSVSNPPVNKSVGISIAIYSDNTQSRRLARFPGIRATLNTSSTATAYFDQELYMNANEVAVIYSYEFRQVVSANNGYTVNSSTCQVDAVTYTYNEVPADPLIYLYNIGQHKLSREDFDTLDQGRGFVRIIDTNQERIYEAFAKEVTYNSEQGIITSGEFIGYKPPADLCWILATGFWNDQCYWLDSKTWID